MRSFFVLALFLLPLVAMAEGRSSQAEDQKGLSLVVMDPLAEPLSCPCVKGYAQRKYEKLSEYLTDKLGVPVHVTFAESFEKALAKESCKEIDIAIGKDSVVRSDASALKLKVTPVAKLTGQDGLTTMYGMIVVRSKDKAVRIEDLKGYRVIFGPKECDEKFAAARNSLVAAGVEVPSIESAETSESCSDGACKIIEWGDKERAAAVISSYAAPLLEGCGTVKKGDLRVIAQTQSVPFVTAFTTNRVPEDLRKKITSTLLSVGETGELKAALETLSGFVPIDDDYRALRKAVSRPSESAVSEKKKDEVRLPFTPRTGDTGLEGWPQWRGQKRDGHVKALPDKLPEVAHFKWQKRMQRAGLGGIAATKEYVVVGDRDLSNNLDEFKCYNARDGEVLWTVQYPAVGKLDYDNTPRATPLIFGEKAFLFGAFGDLTCVEIASGETVWRTNVIAQFEGEKELVWGLCSSPLIADGKLIINPGGKDASIVALEPDTGEVIWQTPGAKHSHSSFIVATLGGRRELVGYDQTSLGGWDTETGARIWTLKPQYSGDFNVPTPVTFDGKLLVATENNFARLYDFDSNGVIIQKPLWVNKDVAPEMSSPVVIGKRAFVLSENLYCIDLQTGEAVWVGEDKAFGNYSPLIASEERLLAFGAGGELILIDAKADAFKIVSRLPLFSDKASKEADLLSHPALVDNLLYLRGEKELVCIDIQ